MENKEIEWDDLYKYDSLEEALNVLVNARDKKKIDAIVSCSSMYLLGEHLNSEYFLAPFELFLVGICYGEIDAFEDASSFITTNTEGSVEKTILRSAQYIEGALTPIQLADLAKLVSQMLTKTMGRENIANIMVEAQKHMTDKDKAFAKDSIEKMGNIFHENSNS